MGIEVSARDHHHILQKMDGSDSENEAETMEV
jgi:hypothetical protein